MGPRVGLDVSDKTKNLSFFQLHGLILRRPLQFTIFHNPTDERCTVMCGLFKNVISIADYQRPKDDDELGHIWQKTVTH
jgi:hypothetical protein